MAVQYISESDLNECLDIILKNCLVFPSKSHFAVFANYPSLVKNNPISKLPYQKKLELLLNIQSTFSIEYSGYDTLQDLIEGYKCTSSFFRAFFGEKKNLINVDTAIVMAEALCVKRHLTGNKKLDTILTDLYDFDEESYINEDIDRDMLLLMVMGAFPPMGKRQSSKEPDYDQEWDVVTEFIHRCGALTPNFPDNAIIYEFFNHWDEDGFPKSRLFFLVSVAQMCKNMEEASAPKDKFSDGLSPKIDGIWQSCQGDQPKEDNVYYEFSKFGRNYNLVIHEDYRTVDNCSCFSCYFYDYDENTPVVKIEHPKAGYLYLTTGKGIGDYVTYLTFKDDGRKVPFDMWFKHFHGRKFFELELGHLRKLSEEKEQELRQSWKSKKRVDKYDEYTCNASVPDCIELITRDDIIIKDRIWGSGWYKVPKRLDTRLKTVTTESECSFIRVGKSTKGWISFPSLALYFNPADFERLGIEEIPNMETDH